MKKLLALALVAAMCLSLVACGAKKEEAPAEGDKEVVQEPIKVYGIYSALGDMSFNDSAHRGLTKAADELGIQYDYIEIGTGAGKEEPTLQEAAVDGYDYVVCNNIGFGLGGDWVTDNAADYPETTFIMFDESSLQLADDVKNVQQVAFKANESDFLAGALAAKMSQTGVISFVGGINNPVIADFLVGYIEGAKYANPDVKVVISYTESWSDATKGKELANAAIGLKADVIHAVAGGAGNGALEAAQEAGLYGIGVDSDQYALFKGEKPELAKSIITSSLKNVDAALFDIFTKIDDGSFTVGGVVWYGMNEGASGLAENENYEAVVPQDVRDYIEEIKTKVAAGEIEISSFYGMDDATYEDLKASVQVK